MSVTALPLNPGPIALAWSLVDFGNTQQGPLGGAAQRINRLGGRWRCEVTLPPMPPALAREWAASLNRGLRTGVSWRIRQVGTPTGIPGAVLVNGGSQAGNALIVDGGTAGYVAKVGQWASILTGGQRYLYQLAATTQLSGTGTGTLQLEPALRVEPADNDPVELGAPLIEGLIAAPPGWSIDANRLVNGFSFVIEESR
jgi:hypothetical protein